MQIFEIISGLCSIASLLISIFVASKVNNLVKVSGSNNTTMTVSGDDAWQTNVSDGSMVINGKVAGDINVGGKGKKVPRLEQSAYPIKISDDEGNICNYPLQRGYKW